MPNGGGGHPPDYDYFAEAEKNKQNYLKRDEKLRMQGEGNDTPPKDAAEYLKWLKTKRNSSPVQNGKMLFTCPKCDSSDIELYGANMRWNYNRQRWQIANIEDSMVRCFKCNEQTPYVETAGGKKHKEDVIKRAESMMELRKKIPGNQCKRCGKALQEAKGAVMSSSQIIGWCKSCYYKEGL